MNLIVNNLKLKNRDAGFIFALCILACVLMAFFKESVFPKKYFLDSYGIQNLIDYPYKSVGDTSVSNTANFFRILGVDRFFLTPLLALVAYFLGIFAVFRKYKVESVSLVKLLLMVAYTSMAMVYISTFSKDLVVYLLVVVPFIFLDKKSLLIWTLFVLFYAFCFRNYWFITISLFWGIKLFIVKKPKLLLLAIPCYYILISFVYHYIFGTPLSMIRYLANLDRDAESAQTAIAIFINGDNFVLEAANYFVTLIFLIAPIPLILLAKPFYIILAGLITVFFYNFIKLYTKEYANKEYTNVFSFVISFMLVQSLFEPDYGSFVKHLAPLYPLIFICIAKNTKFFNREEQL